MPQGRFRSAGRRVFDDSATCLTSGEGGLFGREEMEEIEPAIEEALKLKIDVQGPFAADSVFVTALEKDFDAVVCMYHDQALIPIKTLAFDEGVNVTLGLPFIRTSPDHGTAYDIAGKNLADPASLAAAFDLAGSIGTNRAASQDKS